MEAPNLAAENIGSVFENANISGENIAFRDINNYQNSRPTFSPPNLSAYDHSKYPAPAFTSDAYQQVMENRIIIVSNGMGFDKSSFIRHLAFRLRENKKNLIVNELLQNEEDHSLLNTIRNFEEAAVFIIDQAHPKLFDYDIKKFRELADNEGHYILITTEITKEIWGFSPVLCNMYWLDIPMHNLYSKEVLAGFLVNGLNRDIESLSFTAPVIKESFLLPDYQVQDIATRFETPDQISFFLQLLKSRKEITSSKELEDIINATVNDEESLICKWYKNLAPREQLIALGGALLEGSYDDQFFRIMQDIVKNFWQYRDSFLLSLDYCDLNFLLPFFELEDINDEKRLIRNRYTNQRTDIVYTAWYSYRRHILSTLPLLTKMVIETIYTDELNWEKYGTEDRRMILRQAIGNTISDIGLISFPAVESTLLELASFQQTTVQRVAAKAMARWRKFGQDELLYKTLRDWQHNERTEKLIENFQKNNKLIFSRENSSPKALSYIKATAFLSLMYAASYDSPNQLDQRIIELLGEIAKDKDPLVHARLKESLPRMIHHHSLQLIEILKDFIIIDGLQKPIAKGLTLAYEDYPHKLKEALFNWLESATQTVSNDNRRKKLTYRDKVVATILETYRRISFSGTDEDVITVNEVLTQLVSLRKNEGRNRLQKIITETAAHLIAEHFVTGAPFLTKLYDISISRERSLLLDQLGQIYLRQRQKQVTEHSIKINGESIPAWLDNSSRPLTPVEEHILQWIDEENIELKKLGNSAFLKLVDDFDFQEEIELAQLQYKLSQQKLNSEKEESEDYETTSEFSTFRPLPYTPGLSFYSIFPLWRKVYIFFFLLWKPKEQRWLFKELYKNIFFDKNYRQSYKWYLLRRLRLSSNPLNQLLNQWYQRFLQ